MRRAVLAVMSAVLAGVLLAACGGGGSTTVIEKTVTVEQQGEAGSGGGNEAGGGGSEGGGSTGSDESPAQEGGEAEEGAAAGGDAAEREAAREEATAPREEEIEAPTAVVHLQTFRSPSGNIGCGMFEGGARCDIRKRDWSPPQRPASCPDQVDFGQGLEVGHDGKASFVCAGDTSLDPSAKPLGYGEASELGGTTCMSRSAGITCANHAGHGFFISIQGYKIF